MLLTQTFRIVVAKDVQKLFASGDAGVVGDTRVLEINNDSQVLDFRRHQTDTALQAVNNVLDLTLSVLRVLQTGPHNPNRSTGFVKTVEVHFTSFGLSITKKMFSQQVFRGFHYSLHHHPPPPLQRYPKSYLWSDVIGIQLVRSIFTAPFDRVFEHGLGGLQRTSEQNVVR